MSEYRFSLGEAARSIGNALSWETGSPIPEGQVIVEPTGNFGEYLCTVYENADTLKKVIAFLDTDGSVPTSLGELCLVGYQTNRQPAYLYLAQHGQIIGATESGKTSLLHIMLAHATRCTNCIVWVGGNWKLYNLVGQWLEPYKGTGLLPPIDYVAHGQQDVCDMMAAFLKIADYRMSLPFDERESVPYIILVLDEVTRIVGNKNTKADVNGANMCASEEIAAIATGTAEAGGYMWVAMQRDTFDNLGTEGGTTIAQMSFSFIFRIRDFQTAGRVTNDYGLAPPQETGQCLGDLGPGETIKMLRVPYAQTADPRKPIKHNGPKIPDIAWARRNIVPMRQMDAGSAAAAGEHYAHRFTLVTDEYLTYLRTPKAAQTPSATLSQQIVNPNGLLTGTDEMRAAAEEEWQRMVAEKVAENGNGNGSVTTLADFSQYKTRASRVQAIIVTNDINGGEPLTITEIIEQLETEFEDVVTNKRVVNNILGEFMKSSPPVIGKVEDNEGTVRYYGL